MCQREGPERRVRDAGGRGGNTRILHGRAAFTSAGGHHLQGCYADLDALASAVAVLDRQEVAA